MRATIGQLRRALGGRPVAALAQSPPEALLQLARSGPARLAPARVPSTDPLRIACVIPSFRRGSGGHQTIVYLMRELRAAGHAVSLWLEDCERRHAAEARALTRSSFAEFFSAEGLELHTGFEDWEGADVALATGWQTVARVLLLAEVGARAYLVQDHEPDFYGASAESLWARLSYAHGIHCIAASPWLAGLLRSRYGASASHFDLAVDHARYAPSGESSRRADLVILYARLATPRRAVPLALLALEELARRRPRVAIALYGEPAAPHTRFAHRSLGVLDPAALGRLYNEATVGVALSLTNPSLVSLEMMASGLPCVELASESMLASFGRDGALKLAEPDPVSLCGAIEQLLDAPEERESRARAGVQLMADRTWGRAAEQVAQGLRRAAAQAQV